VGRVGAGETAMEHSVQRSLELWEKHGRHILMAMPYADNLIASGNGCTLQDVDGNRILDFSAGQFCSILGNNHPKYLEKIFEQLKNVTHTGTQFLSPIVLEAARKFAEVAPGTLAKSIFLSTGAEANECAISLAKSYTGKRGVIGFNRGYYGLSIGTKSLTSVFANGDRHGSGPMVPESFQFLAPHCFHCPVKNRYPECELACLDASVELLPKHQDIAAVIVEPVFSAGGMFVPPAGYLKRLRDYAHQIGALLIVDEAQTGFGRTGKWFACEHHEIEPDILIISKSSGAGFPVSGVITTAAIADGVAEKGWLHLSSHQCDPLSAAALAATIDVVHDEDLVEKSARDGAYLMERLQPLKAKYSVVADIRGIGLMVGVEIGAGSDGPPHDGRDKELCALIVAMCEARGVHFTYTYFEPVIRFMPALTVQREEIDFAVSVLDETIGRALKGEVKIKDFLPVNPYSRKFVEKLQNRKSLKRIAARLFETSPKYWIGKFKEHVDK
jgi:2,2-dialkylglycine decarboxylase (pyruvate)